MAGSSIMESLFQRTLEDIIKGIRLNPVGEPAFISKCLEEIRREIKSTDHQTKAIALHKLTYLHSLHALDMSSWASFHVVEVMSFPRLAHKKIGYLAASLSFHDGTDVILLVTNLLRKDLTSTNHFEVSFALEFLSVASNEDLARDLTPELFTLLSSSKIIVRKKVIVVMLRIFRKFPDAVRVCFKRLVENLEGSDPSVVSAVVGVFCELSLKDPNSYLPLAPEFYRILVDSRNNWVLIKVMKIFAQLCPLEPRLARRVVEPISDHMRRTGAKSLMFECIRTVVTSLSEFESAVKLSVSKIHELLVDEDPNLRYLGLQALSTLGPEHLWGVLENKEVVIKSLSDADPNIKRESLRLVMKTASEDNIVEISKVLVNYALKSDPDFCNVILGSVLSTCSRNIYEMIVDFDWYVSLLAEISRIPHCQKGEEIECQLIDIGMRVRDARSELVRVARDLLIDPALLSNPFLHRILSAAAWVSGEYVEFSKNPFELVEALLQPRTSLLSPSVRAIYIQSTFKVLIFCLHYYFLEREGVISTSPTPAHINPRMAEDFNPRNDLSVQTSEDISVRHGLTLDSSSLQKSILSLVELLEVELGQVLRGDEVEVLERAANVLGLIHFVKQEFPGLLLPEVGDLEKETRALETIELIYSCLSEEELGPISASAQERVPVPEGLVLVENLGDLESFCGSIPSHSSITFSSVHPCSRERMGVSPLDKEEESNKESKPLTESTFLLAQHRKRHGLYYLPSEKTESVSDDYPPANDPKSHETYLPEDLVKLAELSLREKPVRAKPRPVVVKLGEGDGVVVDARKAKFNVDVLSGAIQEALTGERSVAPFPSGRAKGKKKAGIEVPSVAGQSSGGDVDGLRHGNVGSVRRKHRMHGKDGKSGDEIKEHRHGRRHKSKPSMVDGSVSGVSVAPGIPDFLL